MPTAILLAGGSGSRFGADKPKQFLDMHGMPIIEHTIRAFHSHPHIDKIIIITRADYIDHVRHIAAPYPKVTHILPGGRERYHSTLAALSVCTDSDELLLIHDAVRPYVSHAIIDRCLAALTSYDAVGTAIPTTDFDTLIAEKSSTKEALVADIASLEENLTALKADLKAKKAELKKLDTELGKLEEQKAAFDAAEAEKAKKAELEETIQKLMADGVSAAEILEKLK